MRMRFSVRKQRRRHIAVGGIGEEHDDRFILHFFALCEFYRA